jgi:ribonuclease HI
MELTQLFALRALKQPCIVEFHTTAIRAKGISQWMAKWERTNFKNGKIQNVDLWQALKAETARHDIHWHWVKGHAGNTYNERADQLAMEAIREMQSAAQGQPPAKPEFEG